MCGGRLVHTGSTAAARQETTVTAQHDPLEWLEAERRHPGGSRVEFRQQLADCDHLLIAAAELVGDEIEPVTNAFLQADTHRAADAVATDVEVGRRCRELEDACYVLLARQAPVASDLRRVVAVLRSITDVQRSSDLLRHIAESLTWVHPPAMPDELGETIGQLGTVTGEIFNGAVEAWRTHDALTGTELQKRDDQVDLLHQSLLTELYTGAQSVEESVSLALIARYYERVADHGVEMAGQVTYFVTGDRPVEEQ
jgi:phosphate transport system protein